MDNGASSYRRYLQGDEEGLAEIVREYKDGLLFYLNGIVENLSLAEDLTEDTFVKIAVKKPRFDGRSSFKTWLFAIGRNLALSTLRKNKDKVQISVEDSPDLWAEEEQLEREYFREEQKILLYRTLRQLKKEYRQVLGLIYLEGFSQKETAMLLKKSVHAVETLVYRARLALRSKLEQEGFLYENDG